jgi:methylenetetrahydrofolate dehydrogenase (NADP+) / methenyltetrahydrofolate cyclohydrolase
VTSVEAGARARILDGRPIAESIRATVLEDLAAIGAQRGSLPGVRIFLIGDDAPSRVYAGRILRNAASVGVTGELVELPGTTTALELGRRLAAASEDPEVGGIIVQMPLPAGIPLHQLAGALDPAKDIDGIHPYNAGLLAQGLEGHRPSCAEAAVEILLRSGYELAGRRAVVIGRSNVVGKPAELLLLRHNATVTVCHRQTRDLGSEVARADVVVVAAGSVGLVTGSMVKPGALIVDCGINVVDGGIVGDVDRASVDRVAGALTPVPGGVGPVTNAVLLRHLVAAIRATGGHDSGRTPDA